MTVADLALAWLLLAGCFVAGAGFYALARAAHRLFCTLLNSRAEEEMKF